MNNIQLSIIMPSLNEEKNLETAVLNVYQAVKKYQAACEVIIINDGSRDRTREIAESLTKRYNDMPVKLINHEKPMGVGYSFRDGTQNAEGEAVTMMPGDGENEAGEIIQ